MNQLQRRQRIWVERPLNPPTSPPFPDQAVELGKEYVKPAGHHQSEEWGCNAHLLERGYCPKGYRWLLDRIWKIYKWARLMAASPAGFLRPPSPVLGCRHARPCLAFHASAELPTSVSRLYSKHSPQPLSHLSSVELQIFFFNNSKLLSAELWSK